MTPIGPIAACISNAIGRTASRFNAAGHIRIVNFPGGGAARITDADVNGPNGARARVFGGSGVTYYWPKGNLRIDGNIEMGGGGLPHGRVTLRQPFSGAPMSGVATSILMPLAASGWHCRRSASVRVRAIRPRSAPRRSSMAAFLAAGSRRCGCRYGARRPGQQVCFWYLVRGRQLQSLPDEQRRLRPDPASGVPGRIGDRQQGPGGRSEPPPSSAARRLTARSARPLHVAAANGQLLGQNFVFNRFGAPARQAGIADCVRRRPPDRRLRARRLRRRLHPGQGDHRHRPAAAQRWHRQVDSATASWRWTAR